MVLYWAAWVGLFNQQVKAQNPESPFQARGLTPPQGPGGRLLRAGGDGTWARGVYLLPGAIVNRGVKRSAAIPHGQVVDVYERRRLVLGINPGLGVVIARLVPFRYVKFRDAGGKERSIELGALVTLDRLRRWWSEPTVLEPFGSSP